MKKLFSILLALFAIIGVKANDGAFYSYGNQLIPITETSIKVQKEVLTITRVPDAHGRHGNVFQVNVYYEFFNPGKAKDLIVGFEAPTPSETAFYGTLDEMYASHPFIYDFKVKMNKNNLKYQLAHVLYKYEGGFQFDYDMRTEDYYKNGRVQDMTLSQYNDAINKIFEEENTYFDWYGYHFYYVYHFNAHFNEGLNVIEHTYTFKGAELVMMDYLFDYILTAANRWANNGIDDFTLILNMGDAESFSVEPTFFKDANEWTFTGKGRVAMRETMIGLCENCPLFHVQSGSLVFHKKNFHPEGELHIARDSFYLYGLGSNSGDPEEQNALLETMRYEYYRIHTDISIPDGKSSFTAEQKRIMKNVPFAYRGYVFEDKGLQRYFNSTNWYVPNPDYKADMTTMNKNEKEWIQFWSK